jgi:hypothetical protein
VHNAAAKPYKTGKGLISVGCPKIWRSERVFTVLDGILRDVDSITLKALNDLDPNAANVAQIVSVVNDLQANVQFSQAQGINNALKLQQIKVNRAFDLQNAQALQKSGQLLRERQQVLFQESLELQTQELASVKAGGADPGTNTQLAAIQAQQKIIAQQLQDINTELAKPVIPDQSTTVDPLPGLEPVKPGTALANLPDNLAKALQNTLQQPTLPASMQMDNVIELLHQRLAREFTVMYDDLVRQSDKYQVYLMEFDIGILPRHGAKDREAQVDFNFSDPRVLAYELYPGASSYNILRGQDKTNRIGISGMAQSIMGLGLAASFNHERHELHSGLSQSLFVSGFGIGTNHFGWLIGPPPYENFVNPGNRVVHALILAPPLAKTIQMSVSYCWPQRELRYHWPWAAHPESCSSASEARVFNVLLPDRPGLHLTKVAYVPSQVKQLPESASRPVVAENNYILLSFREPIDPNLVITAGNKIINRVRDVRGRALYSTGDSQEKLAGTALEQAAVSASRFGFLEKDSVDPDTWLQTSSNSLVMNISRATAGTDVFPVITLAAPGALPGELTTLLDPAAEIRVGEWKFQGNGQPLAAFLPLFTADYSPGRIKVYVDKVTLEQRIPSRLRIVSETFREGRVRPVWLHEAAQVVLALKGGSQHSSDEGWALHCDQEEGTLSCDLTAQEVDEIKQKYGNKFPDELKIWVDQPPYFGREGFWADSDIFATLDQGSGATAAKAVAATAGGNGQTPGAATLVGVNYAGDPPSAAATVPPVYSWKSQPYAVGEWSEARERAGSCLNLWCMWETSIKLKNLVQDRQILNPDPDPKSYIRPCILELSEDAKPKPATWSNITQQTENSLTTVTLNIPFSALPALMQKLHLGGCNGEGKALPTDKPVPLPDLYPKLLPGSVTITSPEKRSYRLQGERLRAIDHVRIEGTGEAIIREARVGYSSVDFFLDSPLPPGSYNLSAIISGMTIPLQTEDAAKKLQPARITVPDPGKGAQEKANPQPGNEKGTNSRPDRKGANAHAGGPGKKK